MARSIAEIEAATTPLAEPGDDLSSLVGPESTTAGPAAPSPTLPPPIPPGPIQPPPAQPRPVQPPARRPGSLPPPTTTPRPATPPRPTDQPAARQPTAVPTQAPRPRPVSEDRRVPQPGDKVCGTCGEANDPTRKFCRRCGSSLVEAVVVAETRPPWYRRIFRRTPKTYAAGERTRSMRPGGRDVANAGLRLTYVARWVAGILFGLGVIGFVMFPSFQGLVVRGVTTVAEQVRRAIAPTFDIERPVSVTASSEVESHPARLLFDTFANTEWQSTEAAPTIEVTFKEPFELATIFVHSGSAEEFVDLRRPAVLEITFSNGSTIELELRDVHDAQQFDIGIQGVESAVIRVVDTNGPAGAPVAISEFEFIRKD